MLNACSIVNEVFFLRFSNRHLFHEKESASSGSLCYGLLSQNKNGTVTVADLAKIEFGRPPMCFFFVGPCELIRILCEGAIFFIFF